MKSLRFQIPARICFFGDHQDYLSLPVIAGTINKYLYVEALPTNRPYFDISLPNINKAFSLSVHKPESLAAPTNYFESGLHYFWKRNDAFNQGYTITIWSDIPINAGLSSSSALVVGWLRFLCTVSLKKPAPSLKELGQWAYEVEVIAFDQPGGLMDQYTIAQGGLLFIDTNSQQSQALPIPSFQWVVAESGVAKKTLEVLSDARTKQQQALSQIQAIDPTFDIQQCVAKDYDRYVKTVAPNLQSYWYAAIHNYVITQKALKAFQFNPNAVEIGNLLNAHQHILTHYIGNTPSTLVRMLNEANKSGALGAKIIGSGGGGCLVALVTEKTQEGVIDAFLRAGAYKAYRVELIPSEYV